jgi:hypothetical protein
VEFERFDLVRTDVERSDEVRDVTLGFDKVFGYKMMSRGAARGTSITRARAWGRVRR